MPGVWGVSVRENFVLGRFEVQRMGKVLWNFEIKFEISIILRLANHRRWKIGLLVAFKGMFRNWRLLLKNLQKFYRDFPVFLFDNDVFCLKKFKYKHFWKIFVFSESHKIFFRLTISFIFLSLRSFQYKSISQQHHFQKIFMCDSKPTDRCGHGMLEWNISIWILDLARYRLHLFPQEGHQFVDCKEFGWIRRHALIKSPWTCLCSVLVVMPKFTRMRISRESVSQSCRLDCVECSTKDLIILRTLEKLFTAEQENGI